MCGRIRIVLLAGFGVCRCNHTHVTIGLVADCKHVRRHGAQRATLVASTGIVRVERWKLLVRVHSNQDVRHESLRLNRDSKQLALKGGNSRLDGLKY